MSQNDIVERVLSRLEERNSLNEDQLIEGIINLLEESGVDLENISEEKLDEIFRSIGKAIGSFMTGGEFKDPARRDADYNAAIKRAGVQRKMRARQAARAQAAKPAAPAAAPAQGSNFSAQNRDRRIQQRREILNRRRQGRLAQGAAQKQDDEKSRKLVNYESRDMMLQKLADILIENRLNGNSTTERVDEIFGAIKSAIKSGIQGFKTHRYNQKLGTAAEKRVAAMPTNTDKQQRAKGLAADKLGDAQKADYRARYGRDD